MQDFKFKLGMLQETAGKVQKERGSTKDAGDPRRDEVVACKVNFCEHS